MPRRVVALTFAFICLAGTAVRAQRPVTILFIGNSFLHGQYQPVRSFNLANVIDENAGIPVGERRTEGNSGPYGGIPGIFKMLTDEAGLHYEVHNELVSGSPLQLHYETALPLIGGRPWDAVVMHDFSTGPVPAARTGNPERFTRYADLLEHAIHNRNPAAQVYLYETFPRADLTYSPTGPYKGDSIEAMAADLHDGYLREFTANGHFRAIAPAGDAWVRSFREGVAGRDPAHLSPGTLNLWGADSYHPSIYGAYLNALVLFKTITGRDPRLGASERAAAALGIAPDVALALQRVAAETSH